jgi:C-terminal processing protease CtpA/Prc
MRSVAVPMLGLIASLSLSQFPVIAQTVGSDHWHGYHLSVAPKSNGTIKSQHVSNRSPGEFCLPADAGLRVGDVILAIDAKSMSGLPLDEERRLLTRRSEVTT